MKPSKDTEPAAIEHVGEEQSNAVRRRMAAVEPLCLRTYSPSQAVISRSEGVYHYTPEGRRLACFSSGVLVVNLGYNPKRWWDRVISYMGLDRNDNAGAYYTAIPLSAYNAVTELEVNACERLLANLRSCGGTRCEQVLWAASGSEAIQKALWAAMGRREGAEMILATRGGFHGKKGLAGATTGDERDHDRDPRVRFISFPMDECSDRRKQGQPLDLARYEAELGALKSELGDRICALITEPYLGAAGSFHPQKEYLQLLQRFCNENDIVFILDEVQSSFGRTGEMYAFTKYGITPDIVVLGKGLGNGIPVSAAVGPAGVFSHLTYGEGSDTFSGNPLACAAVLAVLDEFESTDVLSRSKELEQALEEGLLKMQDELKAVAAVRGEGCVWGIECAPIGQTPASDVANAIVKACYMGDESGRAIHLLGPLAKKVIRVSPPLVFPLEEFREYLDAMFHIVKRVESELSP